MKKGAKPAAEVAPPPPPQPVDTTAQDLLKLYAEQRAKQRLDLLEFTHAKYNDWMTYFGFSMQQELQVRNAADDAGGKSTSRKDKDLRTTFSMVSHSRNPSPPGTRQTAASPTNSKPKSEGPSPHDCPFQTNTPVAEACWTVPSGLAEVDAYAVGLGPLQQCQTIAAAVAIITNPYRKVTWRLSAFGCTHFKLRALYRWFCEFIRIVPPQLANRNGPTVTIQDPAGGAAAPPKKAGGPPAGGKGAGGKGGAAPAAEVVAAPVATATPEEQAFAARSADPVVAAALFARMCEDAGLEVETVKGTLKGVLDGLGKPLNAAAWGWNIVHAEDEGGKKRQYLIDVALSAMYYNPYDMGSQSRRGASSSLQPTASIFSATPSNGGGKWHDVASGSKCFEPFYYFTDPREFAPLHFPDESTKLLLTTPVTRTQWEISPRLSHEFFNLKLRLDSHRKRCMFTSKATPIYISVFVDQLATTDLVCRVFRGQVANVDMVGGDAIDANFVWQQREESEHRVTFSIMVPDVGPYTVAIGGRSNPKRLGAAPPHQTPYTPCALVYQVQVNFVSINEPVFPTQHVSPAIAKLMEPLNHKVLPGPQRFVVVPMVPNVLAVGVVNRVFNRSALPQKSLGSNTSAAPTPTAEGAVVPTPRAGSSQQKKAGKEAAVALPSVAPPPVSAATAPEAEKVLMELLTLNPEKAVYEGTVDLQLGGVDLWYFFGDPASLCVGGGNTNAVLAPPAAGGVADGMSTAVEAGGTAASPEGGLPPSPPPTAGGSTLPPVRPPPQTSAAAPRAPPPLKPVGQFYPMVTNIQVVKRIPAKELSLNEGRSVIQPVPRLEKDRDEVLRLLTAVGVGGGDVGVDPLTTASLLRRDPETGNPVPMGSYFQSRSAAAQIAATKASIKNRSS